MRTRLFCIGALLVCSCGDDEGGGTDSGATAVSSSSTGVATTSGASTSGATTGDGGGPTTNGAGGSGGSSTTVTSSGASTNGSGGSGGASTNGSGGSGGASTNGSGGSGGASTNGSGGSGGASTNGSGGSGGDGGASTVAGPGGNASTSAGMGGEGTVSGGQGSGGFGSTSTGDGGALPGTGGSGDGGAGGDGGEGGGIAEEVPSGPPWVRCQIHVRGQGDQNIRGLDVARDGRIAIVGEMGLSATFGDDEPLTSAGATDGFIAVYTPDCELLWKARFGDNGFQRLLHVKFDDDGNLIVAGSSDRTIDFGDGPLVTSGGQDDVVIAKFDPAYVVLSSARFGDVPAWQRPESLAVDADSNVYLSGHSFNGVIDFGGPTDPVEGRFVAKLSSDLEPLFAASRTALALDARSDGTTFTVESVDANNLRVVARDAGDATLWSRDLALAGAEMPAISSSSDGGAVFSTKSSTSSIDLGTGFLAGNTYAARFDASGTIYWSRAYNVGVNGFGSGAHGKVRATPPGGIVFAGNYQGGALNLGLGALPAPTGNQSFDIFLGRMDASGETLYSRAFRNPDYNDLALAVVARSGDTVLAGATYGDVDFGAGPMVNFGGGTRDSYMVVFGHGEEGGSTSSSTAAATTVASSASSSASGGGEGGGDACFIDPLPSPPVRYPTTVVDGLCPSTTGRASAFTLDEPQQITIMRRYTTTPDIFARTALLEGCDNPAPLATAPGLLSIIPACGLATYLAPPGTYEFASCGVNAQEQIYVETPPSPPTNVSCASAPQVPWPAVSRSVDATPRYFLYRTVQPRTLRVRPVGVAGSLRVTVTAGCEGTQLAQATVPLCVAGGGVDINVGLVQAGDTYFIVDQVTPGAAFSLTLTAN